MEKTYNDIVAENKALKRENAKLIRELATESARVEVWQGHYYDLEKKFSAEIRKLKIQLNDERIIANAIAKERGLLEEANAIREDFARVSGTGSKQPGECKIITINYVNK